MYSVPFDVPHISYDQALATLKGALRFGIQPMLETVEDMLAELGQPDARFRSVQVAGTNGKTSTSRYVAGILSAEGLRCALYTSPELVDYTERMEVAGMPVSREEFAFGISAAHEAGLRVNAARAAVGKRPYDITEFDTLTVAAAVVFARAQVDACVLECGMGGRWDATSAFTSIESVAITGIGLDHMRILGNTLEAIAAEKGAILKPGRTATFGVGTATPTSVEDVLLAQAQASNIEPRFVRAENPADAVGEMDLSGARSYRPEQLVIYKLTHHPHFVGDTLIGAFTTPMASYESIGAIKPSYQAANIACAISVAEQFLGRALDSDALLTAIAATPTPGRFDVVRAKPLALVDAAHNPQSIKTFLGALHAIAPERDERPALLVAALADKDVEGMVDLLAPEFSQVVVTQTKSPRALAAPELAVLFAKRGVEATVATSVPEALALLQEVSFIAVGSITLAGEVVQLMRGSAACRQI